MTPSLLPSYIWPPAGKLDLRILFGNDVIPLPDAIRAHVTFSKTSADRKEVTRTRKRKSIGKDRYLFCPELFTTKDLMVLFKLSADGARNQVATWKREGLCDLSHRIPNKTNNLHVWRKLQ